MSCRAPDAPQRRLVPVTRQIHLMGTVCTMTAFAEDREAGLGRLERFARILESTEAQLSTWREDSVLGRLNRQPLGAPFQLDLETCRLMEEVVEWRRRTDAAFDPAVGSLIDVWGLRSGGRTPSGAEVAAALGVSGLDKFLFSPGDCTATRRADVRIDAGAFGKGEALDRIARSLQGEDFPWLVDLGGQIAVRQAPPGEAAWTVSLSDPGDRQRPVLTLEMTSGSLATSGGSERDVWVGGQRIGHILDPRTGRPAEFRGSTTVWHDSALAADVLSTALHVMGPEEGLAWADRRELAVLYLAGSESGGSLRRLASRNFKQRFPSLRR